MSFKSFFTSFKNLKKDKNKPIALELSIMSNDTAIIFNSSGDIKVILPSTVTDVSTVSTAMIAMGLVHIAGRDSACSLRNAVLAVGIETGASEAANMVIKALEIIQEKEHS